MAKYEIVSRVMQQIGTLTSPIPSQFVEADYVEYERGDAIFKVDDSPNLIGQERKTYKIRIVAIAPREAFSLIREVRY